MIVRQDGSATGSVGGGFVEAAVLREASEMMGRVQNALKEYRYPEGGCGGEVKIFLESFAPSSKVIIFGGGHIGHALASALSATSLAVRVVEERRETLEKFEWPDRVELVCRDGVEAAKELGNGEYYCVVAGFSARHDERIVTALGSAPWRYLGVVGSGSKGEKLREHLRGMGIGEERLERFRCPAGMEGVGGKLPGEIAISIAAEILRREAGK
jgi:xanthine dehydrogenase accessory factor